MTAMGVETSLIYTVISVVFLISLLYVAQRVLSGRLTRLRGYKKFLHFVTAIITLVTVASIGYIWGVFELLIGSLTAAGVLGLVVGFAMLPKLADMINGILIYLDKEIDIGLDIEIEGKQGVIYEITLTRTKIVQEGGNTMLVPNRKFRESVIIIRGAKAGVRTGAPG